MNLLVFCLFCCCLFVWEVYNPLPHISTISFNDPSAYPDVGRDYDGSSPTLLKLTKMVSSGVFQAARRSWAFTECPKAAA